MKKAQIRTYGGADALEIIDAPIPTPGPTELLLKVEAASVNPIDWKIARGMVRPVLPYRLPIGLGYDVSGAIQTVGEAVSGFASGDAVFARVGRPQIGTFAEYVTVEASHVARKPEQLSHAEAAALPLVGLTSWQVLNDLCQLQPQQRVLIHAGAGGIGTIAIQLAKALGAYVITTASAGNHALV
ncbi:MAG TPA: NADP-dependent oxidoreductase, partial [Rhodocyclaceae bacterium]|nr:NADP-dependent oxidoreductase [Rhodocyclaceae bacterium]